MDNCYIYQLKIVNQKISEVISPDEKNHFEKPVTQSGEKIYILTDTKNIIYVGKTKQPIRTRLRIGENPNHETGYHGYKWLEHDSELTLFIFIVDDNHSSEAIEAEIVYHVRKVEKHWPRCQTEIHFSNVDIDQKAKAKEIYRYVNDKISER